ncbi:MAG: copper amine oxidase [Meiothermus sp.]
MGLRLFLMGIVAALGLASAQQLATRQLILDLEGGVTYLNGAPVTLNPPPRTQDGRALLPLRETARVLGLSVEALNATNGMRLGKLEVYPKLKLARLDGMQVNLSDVGTMQNDTLFVYVRTLEVALGLNTVYDASQRLLTLTYIPGVTARDTTRPVARFGTDKREYRIGEPVQITEYSYDPDGQPVLLNFTGREEAYYTPGPKDITLVVTNRAGKSSDPYTVRINVLPEVLNTPRDYALRYYAPGRTFLDPATLSYPVLLAERLEEPTPMLFSDSPENVSQSGVVYADGVSGPARLLAYHVNTMSVPARLLVLATNGETDPATVQLQRLGETSASRVVAVLGQASLMDFLRSDSKEQLSLQPGQTVMLYASSPLAPGQGLNLMADLVTSGKLNLTLAMIEDSLLPANPSSENLAALLGGLPNLEPDGIHVRGTFPNAVRNLRVRLNGTAGRLPLGDGVQDPYIRGVDALTGTVNVLKGNYGVTYRITLEGALGAVGAFSPRGGLYSGAISINGVLMPVPDSGVLYRPDSPMLLFRESRSDQVSVEFVPASGSFLPVNLIFYRLDSLSVAKR